MAPHRSSHPDESGPPWFGGEQQYAEPEGHARFLTHPDEAGYPSRERRAGGRMPPGAPPGTVGSMGQWAGDPRPPVPAEMPQRDSTQHRDPTATREKHRALGQPAGSAAISDGIRPVRRAAAGAVIWIAAVVAALPVVRILRDSAFGPAPSSSGVISGVLVMLGLPLGALGLYGLATGAARPGYTPALHAWLRPPVAYLTIALVLFVAAGLAAD